MKKNKEFYPTQIIFSSTTACNLSCPHCFVNRSQRQISIKDAVTFIESCKNTSIQKIGFTGGEPFLYFEFLIEIIKETVKNDLLFDQIMTNGDWWTNKNQLQSKLQQLYDVGYDGNFGLSWDNFHNQKKERMITFINTAQKIFGRECINVQFVSNDNGDRPLNKVISINEIKELFPNIRVFELPQTFSSEDEKGWQAKKWFTEDYCEGPGNILYIHADGKIAPCCGFANENSELFIGTINDSFDTIMKKASENKMVQLCFHSGLSTKIKTVKKRLKTSTLARKKTGDICTFCDYICKNKLF